jgi:hypothetical protein
MKRSAVLLVALLSLSATGGIKLEPAKIAPDIEHRVAKFRRVDMPFSYARFTKREQTLIRELVAASQDLENIYWRQINPEDIALLHQSADAKDAKIKAFHHYLWINGSHWDQIEEGQPFYGTKPQPPGRNVIAEGLTAAEIESYVKQHPEQKDAVYGERTIVEIVSRKPLKLKTTPYHVRYAQWLKPAAEHLRNAAAASDDKAFATYLRDRATALLTDDYYKSDVEWVELKDPKFDVIFAPYEVYADALLSIKTSYGAAVMVRNEAESRKLDIFQKYVPDIQDALPLPAEDRPSKKGQPTPMEVMDTPFRAGDLRHGYQAVADNLPNDPRIHEKVGSKKIFFKNFMDARVNDVILPLAKRVMKPGDAAIATADGYLASTMMHEICHGLGPTFARVHGKQEDIRSSIGPAYSGLEEAKADVTGMYGLKWLIDHGALPKERLKEYYASYVAGIFRTVRFGTGEAHGRAEMMEFNFLSERGAIVRNANGTYSIDYEKMPAAIAAVAKELLEIEATGDRARAEAWFKKYDVMPRELTAALDRAKDVPVDIDPVVPFHEGVD